LIERHVGFNQPFLDFGCGDGSFLRVAASSLGTGFEIGDEGERTGPSGNRILRGRFDALAGSERLPRDSQAFVTAFDVFEHLPALRRDVALIRQVMRPGGHLFVTVPDIGSVMAQAAGARWNMLLLEHLWYFSRTTLDRFLALEGFVPVAHASVPYDASVGHVLKRLGESLSVRMPSLPAALRDAVLPVPAGVLFAAYRRVD
jgi:SAM-dependent methyltransferase